MAVLGRFSVFHNFKFVCAKRKKSSGIHSNDISGVFGRTKTFNSMEFQISPESHMTMKNYIFTQNLMVFIYNYA